MASCAPTASPERPTAVIAMGLGLAVILLTLSSLLALGSGELELSEGQRALAERFDQTAALPFGFVVTEARQLRSGTLMVILSDDSPVAEPGLPPMTDKERPPPPSPSKDSGRHGMHFVDWSGLPEGQSGTPPQELAFAWYPREQGERVLREQFGHVRFRDLSRLSRDGDTVTVDSGRLDWGIYSADYVRARTFKIEEDWSTEDGQPGGEERRMFHDTMRVNLSLGTECCVLYLRWPRGMPGSKERLEDVLAAFSPRSESDLAVPDGP